MYFFLKFFMVVDLWKVVSKIQLIALRVFGPSFLVHSLIFFTTRYFSLCTYYLDHHMILSDGRLSFFSIIVKFLI